MGTEMVENVAQRRVEFLARQRVAVMAGEDMVVEERVVVPAAAWRRTPPRATRACERCAGTVDRLRCDNSASVYPGAAGASP